MVDPSPSANREGLRGTVARMADSLRHRGPDDGGVWVDPEVGVALGHRRLSIIDLSPQGRQPMPSACKRYIIAFNGEIYNYQAIRRELETVGGAPPWRGHSDTEVMLAAISHWGLEAALERFVGMFAFALWCRKERILCLVRDRLGEKPLYYGWVGPVFLFGSELKALRAHPAWRGEIDHDAVALLLRQGYIPAPYSIYLGIQKLLPGHLLRVPFALAVPSRSERVEPYWSLGDVVERGEADPFQGSESDAVHDLDALLRDAVGQQMAADVPLGAFLSGGVDSSTVVALMQAQSTRPVKTFTIGFHAASHNEAEHAKRVARHIGTDHTEFYVTPEEAMKVIPELAILYDEPFADASQIPTVLVARLARRHVTVSLSGDGGDELFGGYNRYLWLRNIWRGIGWMPRGTRLALARTAEAMTTPRWDRWFATMGAALPLRVRPNRLGEKLHKLGGAMGARNREELYQRLMSRWIDWPAVVRGSREPPSMLTDPTTWGRRPDVLERLMFLDHLTYLPDDILVKVDRACMGVSLESRIPLLDHRVVEFAWRLPLSMKISSGQGKRLLRQVLYQCVPPELIERPKTGFAVPLDSWLRGPLRDWAEGLLDERRLRDEGFFQPTAIREKWDQHLSGRRNWQDDLWSVLMFQAWLDVKAVPVTVEPVRRG